MLRENMPICLCGDTDYGGGGGYIGGGLAYTNFTCNNCKRGAMSLDHWVFMDRAPEDKNSNVLIDYINEVIIPLRRAAEESGDNRPHPPQIPDAVVVFERMEPDEWVELDRVLSASLPLPVDPISVRHREFWAETVKELGAREVPNQYYPDTANNEPWYQFKILDATITFGPRKRVLAIKVERDKPFEVTNIATAAKKDGISYWADDGWHNWDVGEAKDIHVHAFGKQKFDEYLAHIMYGLGRSQGSDDLARPQA